MIVLIFAHPVFSIIALLTIFIGLEALVKAWRGDTYYYTGKDYEGEEW
jgi:hypothetical protein